MFNLKGRLVMSTSSRDLDHGLVMVTVLVGPSWAAGVEDVSNALIWLDRP
jgi:hypothetical protein